tara:strand:- start:2598 stop:3050 length:453 start_codon:yes stop_codon:yes gene_type:complete
MTQIDQIKNYTLEEFLKYWLENKPFTPLVEGLNYVDILSSVTLYREYPFQVELFIAKPNIIIPPHNHPNVDSYEVWVSGDIDFMRKDRWYNHPHQKDYGIRVKHDTIHAAKTGPIGGCFLSIQKWLDDVPPGFIGNNWNDNKHNTRYVSE